MRASREIRGRSTSFANVVYAVGNTYHLMLRPGAETIRACGGLHRFIGWPRALLTDSGGFQVWSLGALRRIAEDGVEFRSHVDGSAHFMSPEVSMEIQAALGSEIVMVFDECAPGKATHDEALRSLELTARWAARSRVRFDELQRDKMDAGRVAAHASLTAPDGGGESSEESRDELSGQQALFGIVQGATYFDLRRESLARTVEIGFDGYAIGGLSVGEEKRVMYDTLEHLAPLLPSDRPR